MKRLGKAARHYLIAVVTDTVCAACRSAPGGWHQNECGPCTVKRLDAEGKAVDTWL
jgi:hypothetical protein